MRPLLVDEQHVVLPGFGQVGGGQRAFHTSIGTIPLTACNPPRGFG
jgi:hypothetical protein